ncbi:hypothetical protein HanXRQr2_Chr09g0375681 [Helianthus annuus]|uniref:Uncharacterized protein n=1 Tax=Helianthus annuus TaxID=4232 RepID=A0A9K3N7E5_HELAN|nr:hypothetical protein HanXRQr2_Chr09g0375681 [Helianthus annuus]
MSRYSLNNVFDRKVAGGMAVAALPEGEPGWISRIRDNFLHPSNESMSAYNNVILGAIEDETDFDTIPTREELILLSSEESAGSSHGLIHRSSRASPQQGPVQEPAGEGTSTPPVVDPTIGAVEQQKEARRMKREEKKTEEKKTAKETASAPTRKRLSNVKLLDYVVVSDSLFGLDAGTKRTALDSDDKVTLTEMMVKKQKLLADKKRELDEQAAAALFEKKLKFMGKTVAPSESEVDLGVFSKKSGNLLEKIFKASSAPRVVQEGDTRVEGAETDWESSEATPPRGTQYKRRDPSTAGGGGRGPFSSQQGLKLKKVEGGGSWLDQNPSCDNLPHIPR